ncbi:MAG: PAS domain S-box protein, partial [Ignavibacteriae bacterium]|nr:PAS domain S-box protein [Ignavibacteriota bacterium]
MKRRPWQIPLGVSLVLWLAMGAAFLALDYFFPSSPTDPSLVNTSTSVLLTRREWLFITAASIAVFIVLRAQSNRPKKETDDAAGDHRKHLRDVRERIEAHIVNSPLAIIEFDAEYRIVRWSPVAEQLFGWTHDEIVGRKISELRWVHEEDIAGVMQISEDMRSGLRPRNLHINRNYRKDGAIIHCEWYNSAIYDDQGKLTSVLSQVLDITERMHAEEELRRSEEKFTVMFEKAPFVAALAKMPDAKIVSVNEAFEREFGYRRDDALGKTPLELGIFPDAEATARILTDVHERRSVHDLELQLHTKSGEVRTFINNIDSVGINGENYIFATGYDITERKRAEEERRRAMQRFQIIGELIPFGTWEADSRGEATYVSKLYLDLVGQTLEEHRQRWQEMLHPDDVQPLADAWKQCVEHGALWEREFRVRGKDGAYRTILARGLPVHDEQGHVTSYVGYNFDVTERKQTEEALLRSSGRTSTILESISDAFFSLDRDWRFTYVNSQAAEQWKMKVSRLIGKKIWDVFPDGMMTEAYAKMRRAMNQHERQTFETYSKLLGHWVQTRIYPSTDGLSVYFIDITERKRAEQALRESEDRFRTMANNLPVIIWVTNAAGEIDMVNRTYEQFFGVTEQMVKPPHSWQPLVHPDDAAAYVGKYMKAADQHTTFSAEARVKRADGEWRWIESYATPRFGPAGEFLGHVGSSPDITDRK